MNVGLSMIFLLVSFCASIAGAICGIGGGVLIKPILDTFGVLSVSSISFLSGCTVLSMSGYSICRLKLRKELMVDTKTAPPMAAGAAMGGIAGKKMFQFLLERSVDKNQVGAVQAACLLFITLGTLLYTINKGHISTLRLKNTSASLGIGLLLGISSSFLGIGGGPINLVVLFYFFSMETKTAAQNSLYIILFSQLASLLNTLLTGTIPEFGMTLLLLMVGGGILGGAAGSKINRKMDDEMVSRLFIGIMVLIMGICVFNIYQFM